MKKSPLAAMVCVLTAVQLLTACAESQSAAWASFRYLGRSDPPADATPLNKTYRYLRVEANGQVALMVLGEVDRDAAGRPVEVWFSAKREILRLQNGRIVGIEGLPIEWRAVSLPAGLPAWREIRQPLTFIRRRDEMPGYRIGLTEHLAVRPIAPPSNTQLQSLPSTRLAWFEESVHADPVDAGSLERPRNVLPPAHYAVSLNAGGERFIYGEQCIAVDLCMSWQAWPPEISGD